ncbi:MAG: 6-hydroxycyclohex-1-ene-1-carbonyl-CoA dehydrogenase [Fidelibacterota bacterium]
MNKMFQWRMTTKDAPLELTEMPIPEIQKNEILIKIAGCGVCHTDISFWHYGVPTRHELPLTLGHEISGTVVDGPSEWMGKPVIVPAVLPCGECDLCQADRSNICQHQLMPGNDFHGGFASHIVVPSRFISEIPPAVLDKTDLPTMSVIADAVSTPYQVIEKSGLQSDEFAVIIGVGGVGLYAAALAKIKGAAVIALDIDAEKLNRLNSLGIDKTLDISGMDIRHIKKSVKTICKDLGAPSNRWKIFEMSGTKPGQELAFALLGIAGTLSIVGFTLDKLEIRLSNLMAFDANIIGTWGCKPELYPAVIDLVGSGKLKISPFTELHPMGDINTVFTGSLKHQYLKRPVMVPDFD